jgi:glutamine synthetase
MKAETDVLHGVRWVRLSFVDVFGVSHAVQLPVERFADAVARGAPFDGSSLEGRARLLESDMLLRPEPGSLVRTSADLARAACTVLTLDGTPWPGDPRAALLGLVDDLHGVADAWTGGAELEFYLAGPDGQPLDRGGYFDDAEGAGAAIARQAASLLCDYGVAVDACHHEAGPGQYELDLAPLSPLALADALVLAKQVVRDVARDLDAAVTFMARPYDGEPGSGLHVHQRSPDLLAADGQLAPAGRSFVAGQLLHANGLSALAAPTINSYKRLHASAEAPGAVVWAHTNRGALVRVSSFRGPDASIEYRGADPAANPYLLVAGLLVAGAHGIEADLTLGPAAEEQALGFDPAGSDSVRFDALPRGLDDALDALLADDVLVDALDSQLLSRLVDGRRAEAEEYRGHVTGWERDRYFDEK